jgi:hypothetical protein
MLFHDVDDFMPGSGETAFFNHRFPGVALAIEPPVLRCPMLNHDVCLEYSSMFAQPR